MIFHAFPSLLRNLGLDLIHHPSCVRAESKDPNAVGREHVPSVSDETRRLMLLRIFRSLWTPARAAARWEMRRADGVERIQTSSTVRISLYPGDRHVTDS